MRFSTTETNPTSDFLRLDLFYDIENDVLFEIFDPNGKSVDKGLLINNHLNVNNLSNGHYFIKLKNGQETAVGQFTVVR